MCEDAINTAHVSIHSQGEFATDLIFPLQCLRVNQNKANDVDGNGEQKSHAYHD